MHRFPNFGEITDPKDSQLSRPRPYRHSLGVFPCCTAIPRVSQWRILDFVLAWKPILLILTRGRYLKRTLNNSINGAGLLAESAVYALSHIDV